MPKRTIIYYPGHLLPKESGWLHQALLYFDAIGVIVPDSLADSMLDYGDLAQLVVEGEIKAYSPKELLSISTPKRDALVDDFMTLMEEMPPPPARHLLEQDAFELHFDRSMTLPVERVSRIVTPKTVADESVFHALESRGYAMHSEDDSRWKIVTDVAVLYMSFVAQYIADLELDATVIGTDHEASQHKLFRGTKPSSTALQLRFMHALPVPSTFHSPTEVVAFKRKRRDELLRFRTKLDELSAALSECEEASQCSATLVRFSEEIERSVNDLKRLMKEERWYHLLGSFQTLFSAKSPGFWPSAAAVTVGAAALAPEIALAGVATGAVLQLAGYALNQSGTKVAKLRGHPFAYLYHAQQAELMG